MPTTNNYLVWAHLARKIFPPGPGALSAALNKNDLLKLELEAQLPLLKPLCKEICEELISQCMILGILSKLSAAERTALSCVWSALKLLLVLPATNTTSERLFSVLRHVNVQSIMTQEWLNNLMVLHVIYSCTMAS